MSAAIIPSREVRERTEGFEWPCERRVAHKPHPASRIVQPGTRTDSAYRESFECPGVLAHPATMSGGGGARTTSREVQAHRFEAFDGASGRACTAMVLRDGYGEDCGLPADDPIHSDRGTQ